MGNETLIDKISRLIEEAFIDPFESPRNLKMAINNQRLDEIPRPGTIRIVIQSRALKVQMSAEI